MKRRDLALHARFSEALIAFERDVEALPGLGEPAVREVLLKQLLESIHRVEFVRLLTHRELSPAREDPCTELFDPLKAAILHQRRGEYEEACWLVFLSVHFGKHRHGGWRFVREVYGRLGQGEVWNWESTRTDVQRFQNWLRISRAQLTRPGSAFGNHRKYESFVDGTAAAVEGYVRWVQAVGSHRQLFATAIANARGDGAEAFDALFEGMSLVPRFGRMGRFDYLAMIGKIGLAPLVPGSAYLEGATGAFEGAKLLLGRTGNRKALDRSLQALGNYLEVDMQVIEDALCNWNKSPSRFRSFRD